MIYNKMHSLISPSDKPNVQVQPVDKNIKIDDKKVEDIKNKLYQNIKPYQVDRYYADPPIHNQMYTLVSFTPSSGAKPDKDNIYGMMKVRGVFATETEAEERAEFLIKNVDSYHELFHAYVGRPFPVTTNDDYANTVRSIDIRKKTTEVISEDILNKKREERSEMTDMKEREKNLLEQSKKAQEGGTMDPFEEYITMNVKRAQLLWTYKETMDKMSQMKESYDMAVTRIKELDEENDSFKNDYREKYMSARREAGIPDNEDSFLQYLGADINTEWGNV